MQLLRFWLTGSSQMGALALMAALSAVALFAQVTVPDGGAGAGDDPGGPDASGGADPGADPTDRAGADGDDPDRHAAGGGDGDDPGGGDPDDVDDGIDTLPEKNVRTRLRRLERAFKTRHQPILSLFTDPRTGQLLDPRDVAAMTTRARDMEELEVILQENPKLTRQILDIREGKGGGRAGDAAVDAALEDAFNEAGVPFETDSDSGKYLLGLAKDVHELKRENKKLLAQLGEVNQRDGARTMQSVETAWKSRTLAECADLPEELKALAVPAVQARFAALRASRQLGRIDARRLIAEIVAPYRKLAKGRTRTAAADAQRRATNNQQRPNAVTRGTGPARPGDSNTPKRGETIRDAKKSFFERVGGSATPGGRN